MFIRYREMATQRSTGTTNMRESAVPHSFNQPAGNTVSPHRENADIVFHELQGGQWLTTLTCCGLRMPNGNCNRTAPKQMASNLIPKQAHVHNSRQAVECNLSLRHNLYTCSTGYAHLDFDPVRSLQRQSGKCVFMCTQPQETGRHTDNHQFYINQKWLQEGQTEI